MDERNVLGSKLTIFSRDPRTGYRRDGCCHYVETDRGQHYICAVMTEAFLQFSKSRGNDLITPRPGLKFPGLQPGDRWCVCVGRWLEALEAGCAPPVVLEATTKAALDTVRLKTLREHEYDQSLR